MLLCSLYSTACLNIQYCLTVCKVLLICMYITTCLYVQYLLSACTVLLVCMYSTSCLYEQYNLSLCTVLLVCRSLNLRSWPGQNGNISVGSIPVSKYISSFHFFIFAMFRCFFNTYCMINEV